MPRIKSIPFPHLEALGRLKCRGVETRIWEASVKVDRDQCEGSLTLREGWLYPISSTKGLVIKDIEPFTPSVTDWLALAHDRLKSKGVSREWFISRNHFATYRCSSDIQSVPEFKLIARNDHVTVELAHEIPRYLRAEVGWQLRKEPSVEGIAKWVSRLAPPPVGSIEEVQFQNLTRKAKSWQAVLCGLEVDVWHSSGLLRSHVIIPKNTGINRVADAISACLDAYEDQFVLR